jgi:hypothetical protein
MCQTLLRTVAAAALLGLCTAAGQTQQNGSPVRVTIKDGKVVAEEPTIPIDPAPRIVIGHTGATYFGLTVEGKRICIAPQGGIWSNARVDNQEINPGFGNIQMQGRQQPLGPGPYGKKRHGTQSDYKMGSLDVHQTIEIVPDRPVGKTAPGAKRKMNTARITYLIENKDTKPHTVEWKVGIDILVGNNDGALFASPTTHPGKVLDGVVLQEKTLPEYLQVLENPNLANPGMVAHMTFKNGGGVMGPKRVVLTTLGALGAWDAPAMQAGGDSACAIYWDAVTLKPGEKRAMCWAYGGGVASNIENEGKVAIALGGSFEPGKLFTVTAYVDDPVAGQALTLDLPAGLSRVEGKEIQPVAPPTETGTSVVLWKARVDRIGDYELKVRSSTGLTQSKSISIQLAEK